MCGSFTVQYSVQYKTLTTSRRAQARPGSPPPRPGPAAATNYGGSLVAGC